MQVTYPIRKVKGIFLSDLVRVSTYSVYEACADEGVDPRWCACNHTNTNAMYHDVFANTAKNMPSFGLAAKHTVIDPPCLIIVSRTRPQFMHRLFWKQIVVTYEAMNACGNVTYRLTADFKMAKETRLSIMGPMTVTLYPRTMTYIATANNERQLQPVRTKFEYKKTQL